MLVIGHFKPIGSMTGIYHRKAVCSYLWVERHNASETCNAEEANTMSKERNTTKENKKKPSMTPKERKAAKRAKKEATKSRHA